MPASPSCWLPVFYGELSLHSAFAPRDWHVHEMLYGYLPAVITGFLFTAIPNWRGRLPIQGKPQLALVLVWAAGRVGVTVSADVGGVTAAAIDVGFLVAGRDGGKHGCAAAAWYVPRMLCYAILDAFGYSLKCCRRADLETGRN
jgi:hypothetical protein